LKLHKQNGAILNAEDKFGDSSEAAALPEDLTQLGELAINLLNDKNLEVSKVRPFFWSLVETYVDRFQLYPFDMKKALFSYLELNDFPEDTMLELVKQLESQFERSHGRPLREPAQLYAPPVALDEEIKALRDSLRYAAMVAEQDN
jgi:hypothetical protein